MPKGIKYYRYGGLHRAIICNHCHMRFANEMAMKIHLKNSHQIDSNHNALHISINKNIPMDTKKQNI